MARIYNYRENPLRSRTFYVHKKTDDIFIAGDTDDGCVTLISIELGSILILKSEDVNKIFEPISKGTTFTVEV